MIPVDNVITDTAAKGRAGGFATDVAGLASDHLRTAKNSYRGTVPTRTGTGWEKVLPYRNGSRQSRLEYTELADRAFGVYENNPVGRGILETELTNVIADGFRLQAKAIADDDGSGKPKLAKDWNSEVEDRWMRWLEQADVRGMLDGSKLQRYPYRSSRRDGCGGIVLVDQGGDSRLQFVPSAKICNPDDRINDPSIINGVELNASLVPIAYHLLDIDDYGKRNWSTVFAKNFIYLVPEMDDDLGVGGPSCYATVFKILDQLEGYVDGVALAARMATVFGMVIKSDTAPNDFRNLKMISSAQSMNGAPEMRRAITLDDQGMIKLLGSKDDIVQIDAKQPMVQTPEFIRSMLRLAGLPFQMPLELIAHDMSTVTFASARIGLLGYYRSCYARQKWYKSIWSRIYQWWVSRERKRQQLGLPFAFTTPFPQKFFPHSLHARAWSYTDPIRDPQSDQLQMDMGIKSDQQVCSERGYDFEQVQIERAAAAAFRRALNLPTDIRSTLTRDVVRITSQVPVAESTDDGTEDNTDKTDGYDYSEPNENGGD